MHRICLAFSLLTISVSLRGTTPTVPSLRPLATAVGLNFGVATSAGIIRTDAAYRETLLAFANTVVAENDMKFETLSPGPGLYDFRRADALIEFAAKHELNIRGHVLVWHHQLPDWLKAANYTAEQARELMRTHIFTVMGRYRGRILQWDVVNEAIADAPGAALRKSFWLETIGPEYIALAFRYAHEADPNAQLFYNDYAAEDLNPKSNAVYELVRDLKQKGVPITGVGLQCHFAVATPPNLEGIAANLQRLADLGLELAITEFDARLRLPVSAADLEKQAVLQHDLLALVLRQPACRTFMFWGLTDARSWVPTFYRGYGDALPFDATLAPKRALYGLEQALRQAPPVSDTVSARLTR